MIVHNFEISSKEPGNGRRKFKAVLYEIYPDSCIDEDAGAGTMYNSNGITWIRRYCESALPSIRGMSLKCEFLDEERTELCGHGQTAERNEDGLPEYEDAVVIGTFDCGYIEDRVMPDGSVRTFCIGEGTIDGLCYHNLCERLSEEIGSGKDVYGSIEILKTGGNDGIIYRYGYKDVGRIPMVFEHSGYALLGVAPADESAKIIELNNKGEGLAMTENDIQEIVAKIVSRFDDLEKCRAECDRKVAEANSLAEQANAGKDAAEAEKSELQAALDECKRELQEKSDEAAKLADQLSEKDDEVRAARAKENQAALMVALAQFSDEEKALAQDEIDKFNADPVWANIDKVVDKIYIEIGKHARESASGGQASEQNSAHPKTADIFADIDEPRAAREEDTNIF